MESVQKLIALVQSIVTWWFFVEPWETAIRVRAGSRVKCCGPGVHLKIPLLDSVYVHNARRTVQQVPAATLSSADGAVFTISVAISLRIVDAMLLHAAVHDPRAVVNQIVWQTLSAYVSTRKRSEIDANGVKVALDTIDLSIFGLGEVEACVSNFAAVKTYRFISDGLETWTDDGCRIVTHKNK